MAVSARERNTGEESGVTATWLTARTLGPGAPPLQSGRFRPCSGDHAAPNRIHQSIPTGICDRQNVQPPDRVGTGANLVGDRQDDSTRSRWVILSRPGNGPRNRIRWWYSPIGLGHRGPARIIVAPDLAAPAPSVSLAQQPDGKGGSGICHHLDNSHSLSSTSHTSCVDGSQTVLRLRFSRSCRLQSDTWPVLLRFLSAPQLTSAAPAAGSRWCGKGPETLSQESQPGWPGD